MTPVLLAAVLVPLRVEHAPVVDGQLGDSAWTHALASETFTQKFPSDGVAPTQPTRVRVVYDDDSVYIAIECVQVGPRRARLTRRDREVADDRVSIDIDTARDRRSAFHFQISAAGVLVDGLRYGDTEMSSEWDDIWEGEVTQTATGWNAEIRIPLRILRLHEGVDTWGFQVRRWNGVTGEMDEWAYAPRDAGGEVSRYGELGPFGGLAPRGSIAIVPFALSRLVRTDASMPSSYGDGASAAAGLDVTWRPASNVVVAGAVLPDFAQVEADQVVVNLTTTETEYPEKRPFFLQGLDLFETPIRLLYTRRIGPSVLGAAKVFGNVRGIELAALSALTDEVVTPMDVTAQPIASHHVARMRVTRDELAIGALATARVNHEDVAVPDPSAHDALAASLDAAWRSETGEWTAGTQLAGTRIEGGPARQRPDGTIVAAGDSGGGGVVKLAREGGTLRGEAVYEVFSRRFDIDDLGYLPRANLHHGWLDLEAYTAHTYGPLIESRARLELYWRRNLDGLALPSGYQWNVSGTTKSMWEGFLEVHWRPSYFDDRELGDGRALQRSGRLGLELEGRTDSRRSVIGGASVTYQATQAGYVLDAGAELELRPRDNIEITIEPGAMLTRGEPRFLEDDMSPRFARQDVRSLEVTTRATWTLTRNLTLQGYVQALLATIRYRDAFISDPNDRVISLGDLQAASFDPAMYDGREGALNATAIARWEYRPGSTAYLVYSHAQIPDDADASYEPRALVHGPASDVVMLKLSWAWLR
jgi:hypothetical protein